MAYKYPFIPREYYAATMFACKMIRENGYFNKAIQTAANYYDVDRDELEKHVRKRQGAGQKGKTRKYSWFVVCGYIDYMANDDCGTQNSWDYSEEDYLKNAFREIVRATSEENAKAQIAKKYDARNFIYSGGRFASVVHCQACDAKAEAENQECTEQDFIRWVNQRNRGGAK